MAKKLTNEEIAFLKSHNRVETIKLLQDTRKCSISEGARLINEYLIRNVRKHVTGEALEALILLDSKFSVHTVAELLNYLRDEHG